MRPGYPKERQKRTLPANSVIPSLFQAHGMDRRRGLGSADKAQSAARDNGSHSHGPRKRIRCGYMTGSLCSRDRVQLQQNGAIRLQRQLRLGADDQSLGETETEALGNCSENQGQLQEGKCVADAKALAATEGKVRITQK